MQTLSFLADPLVCLAIGIVFYSCFLFVKVRRRNYPPGPWGFPIVGNLPQLGSSPHVALTRLSRVYGDVFSLKLGTWDAVVLNSETVAREALLKRSRQFSERPALFTFTLGGVRNFSIAFGEYNSAQVQRKRCALRAIHNAVFAKVEHLNEAVADAFQEFKRSLSDDLAYTFQPCEHLKTLVIKIMFEFTFGNGPSNEEMSEKLQKIMVGSSEFTESSAACALVDFLPWAKVFIRKQIATIENSIQGLMHFVETVYDLRKSSNGNDSCIAACYKKLLDQERRKMDFRELSIPVSTSLKCAVVSDEEIVKSIAADIFGAGLETVSNALCWAMAYLVNNPGIQQDLQKELDGVVGRHRLPTIEDRPSMPLLQATVLEVLRIATVLPLALPHLTAEKTSLGGYEIPTGTLILVNLWAVNHDPRIFEDPNSFKPSRFLDEHGYLRTESSVHHIPFSIGSRRCLGGTLAKAEIFLLLACLLQQFEFSSPTLHAVDLEGLFGMTLKPKPFSVRTRPR